MIQISVIYICNYLLLIKIRGVIILTEYQYKTKFFKILIIPIINKNIETIIFKEPEIYNISI